MLVPTRKALQKAISSTLEMKVQIEGRMQKYILKQEEPLIQHALSGSVVVLQMIPRRFIEMCKRC